MRFFRGSFICRLLDRQPGTIEINNAVESCVNYMTMFWLFIFMRISRSYEPIFCGSQADSTKHT